MTQDQQKQDAIRNAWIAEIGEETYRLAKISISEIDGGLELSCNSWEVAEFENLELLRYIPMFEDEIGIYRPKSLRGIENNRNWIKIESVESLPEVIEGLWEVIINGEQKFIELLKDNRERLYKDFVKDGITHYQIPTRSLPPLF